MELQRAYSFMDVKAIDSQRRQFSGWATTPATDRVGDVINPMGATFTNPLVLLHQHNHEEPIGSVTFSKPTAKGIQFDAEIPNVTEPGAFKDRCDLAWSEISYGVVRAVSIGFKAIKYAFLDDGGIDFQAVEIYELSTVSVPALPQAVITQIKSMSGAPLSRETIQLIKNADRKSDGIKLVSTKSLSGAIKLIR